MAIARFEQISDSEALFHPGGSSPPRGVIIHTEHVRSLYDGAADLIPGHFKDTNKNKEDISYLNIHPGRSTPMLRFAGGIVTEMFAGGNGILDFQRNGPGGGLADYYDYSQYTMREKIGAPAVKILTGDIFRLRADAEGDGLKVIEIYAPSFKPEYLQKLES